MWYIKHHPTMDIVSKFRTLSLKHTHIHISSILVFFSEYNISVFNILATQTLKLISSLLKYLFRLILTKDPPAQQSCRRQYTLPPSIWKLCNWFRTVTIYGNILENINSTDTALCKTQMSVYSSLWLYLQTTQQNHFWDHSFQFTRLSKTPEMSGSVILNTLKPDYWT